MDIMPAVSAVEEGKTAERYRGEWWGLGLGYAGRSQEVSR